MLGALLLGGSGLLRGSSATFGGSLLGTKLLPGNAEAAWGLLFFLLGCFLKLFVGGLLIGGAATAVGGVSDCVATGLLGGKFSLLGGANGCWGAEVGGSSCW